MFGLPALKFWFSAPAIVVFFAVAVNLLIGILGMSPMQPPMYWAITSFAILVAVFSLWSAADQERAKHRAARESTNLSSLVAKIAIVNGVDPDESSDEIARKVVLKNIGQKSVSLSEAILRFLAESGANDIRIPRSNHWNEDAQADLDRSVTIRQVYDERFLAETLSTYDLIKSSGYSLAQDGDRNFVEARIHHPTNPLGMREVAALFGRAGKGMLEASK